MMRQNTVVVKQSERQREGLFLFFHFFSILPARTFMSEFRGTMTGFSGDIEYRVCVWRDRTKRSPRRRRTRWTMQERVRGATARRASILCRRYFILSCYNKNRIFRVIINLWDMGNDAELNMGNGLLKELCATHMQPKSDGGEIFI